MKWFDGNYRDYKQLGQDFRRAGYLFFLVEEPSDHKPVDADHQVSKLVTGTSEKWLIVSRKRYVPPHWWL